MVFIFKFFKNKNIKHASNLCAKIAKPLTKLICKVNGRHAMAIKNLKLCFPNKTSKEVEEILGQFYENIGRFIGEYIAQSQMTEEYFKQNVEVVNPEILDEYFKKGFFGITAHFGNWELLHKYLSIKGQNLNVIYRKQNNMFIEKAFIDDRPVNLIPKNSNAMRQIMSLIKAKKIIGILIDQRDNGGEKFKFFGRDARTGVAIQRLSLKYNYPMIFVKCVRKREDPNKFTMFVHEPIKIETTGDIDKDIKLLTDKTLSVLEDWIKEDPEQWFWIYDRWKDVK